MTSLEEYNRYYDIFLHYNNFINESYNNHIISILTESSEIIMESELIDKTKKFVNKIINTISNWVGQFFNYMTKLFSSNKDYLNKYKDIILKKKPIDAELNDFYEYDIKLLVSSAVPPLQLSTMKDVLKSKEDFYNSQYFNKFYKNPKITFIDNCKSVFRGQLKNNYPASSLNMTEIFNYCYSFKSADGMENTIKKDIKTFNLSSAEAYKILDDLNQSPKTTNTTTPTAESSYYTFDQYFTELNISNNSNTASVQDKNTMAGTNIKNLPDKNIHKIDPSPTDDLQSVQNAINVYFTVCNEFLSAKLSIAQAIYKDYISIITWHINQYAGGIKKNDKKSDIDQKQGTDYSKPPNITI